jgi:MFS family permease
MPTFAKTLIACAALAALWFALQVPINMVILLIAATREEGQWWITLMKNAFSPALSAYFAFAIVERFHRSVSWRAVTAFFVCALIAYTIWSIGFNAEHYLLSNRVSEWRGVLWETILSSVSAVVVAIVLYVQRAHGAPPSDGR